jgi:hypothetical protein
MSGIPKSVREARSPWCTVVGCSEPRRRLTFCNRHYKLNYRNGDPEVQKRASSTAGVSQAFKKEWVRQYKVEHGCVDCGYNANPVALGFDHLPGTVKVRDIKSGQQLGWQALQDEIAKCEVVCMNCHHIRTSERRREVTK